MNPIRLGEPNAIYGGACPDLPIVIPKDAMGYKLRVRNNAFVRLFIFYRHKTEMWCVMEKDGKLWPVFKQAENRHPLRKVLDKDATPR